MGRLKLLRTIAYSLIARQKTTTKKKWIRILNSLPHGTSNYKMEIGGTPFCRYGWITQNSYWARTRKQWIRSETCSNEKAVTFPAEVGTGIIANQR